MIRAIAQFIEGLSGCGWVIGENLFVGGLPLRRPDGTEPPVRCMVVLENTPAPVNFDLPDQAEKAIQIWNRAADYMTARDDAYCVFTALHGTAGWALPVVDTPYYCATITAVGQPAPVANPNAEGNYELSTNYIFIMAEEPLP